MEQTLFDQKDLAKRWSCSPNYITKLEEQGILTRVNLSKRMYPINQIREIEMSEVPSPTLSEVKRLRDENRKLIKQNAHLKNSITELTKAIYGDFEE